MYLRHFYPSFPLSAILTAHLGLTTQCGMLGWEMATLTFVRSFDNSDPRQFIIQILDSCIKHYNILGHIQQGAVV